MMNKSIAILLLSFSFSMIQLNAQDIWSLEKCITHAFKTNIDIQQADLNVDQAEVTLSQAQQQRMPSLNANTGTNWNFGRTIDPTTNDFITETFFSNNYSLSTGMSIFNGFQINNSIQQSKLDLEASRADAVQVERNTALTVSQRYLDVLFAKENISISERQLEQSEQQLERTILSIEAGALPESEKLNLEAQIASSEQALILARNNLAMTMLSLKQVLRLDPSFPLEVQVPEGIEYTTDPDMVYFEEAFAEALKNRFDIHAAELRIQSAEYGKKIAKGSYYPSINIGGSLGSAYSNQAREITNVFETTNTTSVLISSPDPSFPLQNVPVDITTTSFDFETGKPSYFNQLDNNLSYGFGVGVSIPIYNRGVTNASVQRAELGVINAQLNHERSVENLKIIVQSALADARAAKKKLEASEKTYNAQKLAFDNTSKRLELGATNTFEWESQKTQMENSEFQSLIDKYDYLFKIKILEFLLGKPLKLN